MMVFQRQTNMHQKENGLHENMINFENVSKVEGETKATIYRYIFLEYAVTSKTLYSNHSNSRMLLQAIT
jgi:hypothetical protein